MVGRKGQKTTFSTMWAGPADARAPTRRRDGAAGRLAGWRRGVTVHPMTSATRPRRGHPVDLDALSRAEVGRHRQLTSTTLAVCDDNYRWLPDRSVDLVLTDPPFNIAQDTNFHTWEGNTVNSYRFDKDKGWDTYSPDAFITLLGQWAAEFARVLRPGGTFAVFCADDYLSHLITALETAGLRVRRTVTWRKPNAVPVNRKTMMMSACEYLVVGVKGRNATFNADIDAGDLAALADIEPVLVGDKAAAVVEKAVRDAVAGVTVTGPRRAAAVAAAVTAAVTAAAADAAGRAAAMYVDTPDGPQLRGCVPNHVSYPSKSGNRLHPTEKPVTLLRYLTALLSRRGDTVLDPFAGSGSTGQAAIETGRRCIVVETDDDYYQALSGRLARLDAPADTGGHDTGNLPIEGN